MRPLSYRNIHTADISEQNPQLHNQQFDDIYHHQDALAESRYVFHVGNQLLQQWQENATDTHFVIGETGFGSGLNFLTTRQLWQNTTNKPKQLHFISSEQWLLTPEQLQRAYQDFSDLQPDVARIQHVFHQRRAGFHRFQIDQDITLYLLLGDASSCLQQLNARVDAWFLDGFSPAKNPAMWSLELFTEMARLSVPGSTFATFTAASQVRKNLQKVGFEVTKTAGFQGKRERLVGQFKAAIEPVIVKKDWAPTPKISPTPERLTIIGGGIAGLCLAQVARQRGLHVTLIDQYEHALSGASGNPYALMMPYLTAQSSPEALFYWRAFEAAVQFYPDSVFNAIGVQATDKTSGSADGRTDLPNNLIQATENGFIYPGSGIIDTTSLLLYLLKAVDVYKTAQVSSIEQTTQGQWQINDASNHIIDCCDVLLVAAGIQSVRLLPEFKQWFSARRGQTELYQLADWPSEFDRAQLNNGYLLPIKQQQQVLMGGDYQHIPESDWFKPAKADPQDPQKNLNHWQKHSHNPALENATLLRTHSGIRANSLDHLPLCGPVVDGPQFKKDYADLHHGRHWQSYPAAQVRHNLYLLTGLGSRGYTSAPLLAEYLIAMILNQPLPLEHDLVKILHPNRFYYRQLKKPPR